jgi:hypothetical protein
MGKNKTNLKKKVDEIKKKNLRWIGQTLRKLQGTITEQALSWNPQGKRKRGRPKNTWGTDLEKDRSNIGKSWRKSEILAKDRKTWNAIVTDLFRHGS